MSPGGALDEPKNAGDAVRAFDRLGRFASLGLSRIEGLMDVLGHPERTFGAYHVGGTNGKGSVSAHLAAMLWGSGFPAGLYTSPALQDPSERIIVNGYRIAADALVSVSREVLGAARALPESPTAFEAWTTAAFFHFTRRRVPFAIVEVGLGGRGDATAVLDAPLVSVVTTVHLDHTAQLGSTLGAIAAEKAGIFRPRRPVVLGRLTGAARAIAEARAKELHAPMLRLGWEIRVDRVRPAPEGGVRFDLYLHRLDGRREVLTDLGTRLSGAHQAVNAALAVAALRAAEGSGGPVVSEEQIRRRLMAVVWPGRLEQVGDVCLDGAHNLEAARALARHLGQRRGHLVWIVGGLRDRTPGVLLDALLPLARRVAAVPVERMHAVVRRRRGSAPWSVVAGRQRRFRTWMRRSNGHGLSGSPTRRSWWPGLSTWSGQSASVSGSYTSAWFFSSRRGTFSHRDGSASSTGT